MGFFGAVLVIALSACGEAEATYGTCDAATDIRAVSDSIDSAYRKLQDSAWGARAGNPRILEEFGADLLADVENLGPLRLRILCQLDPDPVAMTILADWVEATSGYYSPLAEYILEDTVAFYFYTAPPTWIRMWEKFGESNRDVANQSLEHAREIDFELFNVIFDECDISRPFFR